MTLLFVGMPLSYIWLAVVPGFLSFLLAVFMLPMPDTPRYLLMKHKRERALSVLRTLRGPTADIKDECYEIETSLQTLVSFLGCLHYLPSGLFSFCLFVFCNEIDN